MMILIFGLFTQINDLGPHGPLVLAHDLDIIVVVVCSFFFDYRICCSRVLYP